MVEAVGERISNKNETIMHHAVYHPAVRRIYMQAIGADSSFMQDAGIFNLLVIQSMNTALQLTRPYSGKFFLKLITGILNVLVLCLGILFAFMIFIVF